VEHMRALLPPAAFERVIENVWSSGSGDFVTSPQWAACVDERLPHGTGGRGWRAGLDLGLTKDRTALAGVHRGGEHVVLDGLQTRQGPRAEPVSISGVERAVVDATERYPGLVIAADPWQLKGSIERLQRAGVQIREHVFSSTSVQKLSTALYAAISTGTLRVY